MSEKLSDRPEIPLEKWIECWATGFLWGVGLMIVLIFVLAR